MGWNKKELAERAGVHPTHIGLIERGGRVDVRYETLEKIATAFGGTVPWLMGEDEEGQTPASDLEPYRAAIEAAKANGLSSDDLVNLISTAAALFRK